MNLAPPPSTLPLQGHKRSFFRLPKVGYRPHPPAKGRTLYSRPGSAGQTPWKPYLPQCSTRAKQRLQQTPTDAMVRQHLPTVTKANLRFHRSERRAPSFFNPHDRCLSLNSLVPSVSRTDLLNVSQVDHGTGHNASGCILAPSRPIQWRTIELCGT